jgi:hypothetical protein
MLNHKDSIHVATMSQFERHTLLGLPSELMDLTLAHLDDSAKGNVARASKDMRQIVATYHGSERRPQEYRIKSLTEILRELADPARSPCIQRQVGPMTHRDARGCKFLRDAVYRKILAPHVSLFAKVKSEPGSRVVITFSPPENARLFYTLILTHTAVNTDPKVGLSMTYRKRRYPAWVHDNSVVMYGLNNKRRGDSVAARAADLDTVERVWVDAGVKADLFDWRRNGSRDLPPSVNLALGIMAFCLVETVVYRHDGVGYRLGFPVIGGNPGPQIGGRDSLAVIIESCQATLTVNGAVSLNAVPLLTRWNF